MWEKARSWRWATPPLWGIGTKAWGILDTAPCSSVWVTNLKTRVVRRWWWLLVRLIQGPPITFIEWKEQWRVLAIASWAITQFLNFFYIPPLFASRWRHSTDVYSSGAVLTYPRTEEYSTVEDTAGVFWTHSGSPARILSLGAQAWKG